MIFHLHRRKIMAYTPQLNESAICALRRLAWSENQPMTRVLEEAVFHKFAKADRSEICANCLDPSKCSICYFNKPDKKQIAAQKRSK